MAKSTIQNNYGDPQIKTAAPAEKQPSRRHNPGGYDTKRTLADEPIAKVAEQYLGRPAFQSYERVEVVINPNSEVFTQLSARIHNEICRVGKALAAPGAEYITLREVSDYLKSIIQMRVLSVSGRLPFEYRNIGDLKVHPFFAVILDQIGIVRDNEFGIDFIPVLDAAVENSEELSEAATDSVDQKRGGKRPVKANAFEDDETSIILKPAVLLEISERLFYLEPAGLRTVGVQVWKDTTGCLEFMSLQHVDGVVRGTRISHSVYGLFASMFATLATYENVGLIPRVTYGYDYTYKMYLDAIFNRY